MALVMLLMCTQNENLQPEDDTQSPPGLLNRVRTLAGGGECSSFKVSQRQTAGGLQQLLVILVSFNVNDDAVRCCSGSREPPCSLHLARSDLCSNMFPQGAQPNDEYDYCAFIGGRQVQMLQETFQMTGFSFNLPQWCRTNGVCFEAEGMFSRGK